MLACEKDTHPLTPTNKVCVTHHKTDWTVLSKRSNREGSAPGRARASLINSLWLRPLFVFLLTWRAAVLCAVMSSCRWETVLKSLCVQISISHVRDTPALWISCVNRNISVLTKLFLMLSYRECLAVLSISSWRIVKSHVADGRESGWSHDCHNSLLTLCLFACRQCLLSITSIKDDHLLLSSRETIYSYRSASFDTEYFRLT